MTLAESMAIAVLKGDMTAALALADQLIEERGGIKAEIEKHTGQWSRESAHAGRVVYNWPEFRAFAERLGVMWHLRTVEVIITMRPDEPVHVNHTYLGIDDQNPNPHRPAHPGTD